MNICELSVTDIIKKLKDKEITTTEVVNAFFERIEEVEPKVDAFLTLTKEDALKYAKEIGQKLVDDHVDAVILTST